MADFNYTYQRLLDAIRAQQMGQAQSISDAVPRGNPLQDLYYSLPQLRPDYQPAQYYGYGRPVRLAGGVMNDWMSPEEKIRQNENYTFSSRMPEYNPQNLDKLRYNPEDVMQYREYLRKLGIESA